MVNSESPLQVLQAFFPQNSVLEVSEVMDSPIRNIVKLQLQEVETLVSGMIATQGKPENIPFAALSVFIERMEDPIKLIQMLFSVTAKEVGKEGVSVLFEK